MPLYEFQCDECGHRFEIIQKFSDAPPAACPKCGGPVHKLVSSPAFQFKGTGWYVTDYAKKSDAKKSDDKSSGASAESKDGSARDAKDTSSKDTSTKDAGASGSTSTPAASPTSAGSTKKSD